MLSWARFIVDACQASKELTLWEAYCHGASLMHLDGLGLGAGLALEDAAVAKAKAMSFLASQVPPGESVSSFGEGRKEIGMHASQSFGSHPFFIPLGALPILESSFNLVAPTTSLNMFRVLRAMQLSKPVLLEGSPGVGKTRYVTFVLVESFFSVLSNNAFTCVIKASLRPLLQHLATSWFESISRNKLIYLI
jgi:midasin